MHSNFYTVLGNSLLLEQPVPFKRDSQGLHMEHQAFNGLERWLDNFDIVTVCAPIVPDGPLEKSITWRQVSDLKGFERLNIVCLPWGYHLKDHLLQRNRVRRLLEQLIPIHRYLLFTNLGWRGAWGNIAAKTAEKSGRKYSVWLDWVLHDMPIESGGGVLQYVWKRFDQYLLKTRSLHAIRNASMGLFHGRTVYEGYARYNANPQLVHDIHLKAADIIDEKQLERRLSKSGTDIHIGYVGRVHPMKDPKSWIAAVKVLRELVSDRCNVRATWVGTGPLLDECREIVKQQGLDNVINFRGQETDRTKVVEFLRNLDLFVFCHVTPESPRCLIEALMSGVPLVGFESAYARDLVFDFGGGAFVEIGAVNELAKLITDVIDSPEQLIAMTKGAYTSGTHFSDDAVFKHRSELIKKYT